MSLKQKINIMIYKIYKKKNSSKSMTIQNSDRNKTKYYKGLMTSMMRRTRVKGRTHVVKVRGGHDGDLVPVAVLASHRQTHMYMRHTDTVTRLPYRHVQIALDFYKHVTTFNIFSLFNITT